MLYNRRRYPPRGEHERLHLRRPVPGAAEGAVLRHTGRWRISSRACAAVTRGPTNRSSSSRNRPSARRRSGANVPARSNRTASTSPPRCWKGLAPQAEAARRIRDANAGGAQVAALGQRPRSRGLARRVATCRYRDVARRSRPRPRDGRGDVSENHHAAVDLRAAAGAPREPRPGTGRQAPHRLPDERWPAHGRRQAVRPRAGGGACGEVFASVRHPHLQDPVLPTPSATKTAICQSRRESSSPISSRRGGRTGSRSTERG